MCFLKGESAFEVSTKTRRGWVLNQWTLRAQWGRCNALWIRRMGPWVIFSPRHLRSCVTCWSCQRYFKKAVSKEHLLCVKLRQQPWLLHLWKVKFHNPDVNPGLTNGCPTGKVRNDSHTLLMTILQAVYVADEDDAKAVLKKPEERGEEDEEKWYWTVLERSTKTALQTEIYHFCCLLVHRKDDLFSSKTPWTFKFHLGSLGWMDFTSGRFHRFRWWKLPLSWGLLGEIHVLTTFTTFGDGSATTWWAFGNATDCAWDVSPQKRGEKEGCQVAMLCHVARSWMFFVVVVVGVCWVIHGWAINTFVDWLDILYR